jgi:cytochrome b
LFVSVWDPLVRIAHWSVAILVAVEMLNEAGANPWHRYLGYTAGALVMVRLAWGLCGSRYARLTAMAQRAKHVVPYLRSSQRTKVQDYAGHNPLGACMAFALWLLVLLVVITGGLLQLDAFWGDDTMQAVHAAASYVLAAGALVHVAGVLVTSAVHRTHLVRGMITGKKAHPE